jgi:class 3 adenylate cyclase
VKLSPAISMEFRVGIHLGDVVEESDGDLMGDGVNIAARLEGIAKPGAIVYPSRHIGRLSHGSILPSVTWARLN